MNRTKVTIEASCDPKKSLIQVDVNTDEKSRTFELENGEKRSFEVYADREIVISEVPIDEVEE